MRSLLLATLVLLTTLSAGHADYLRCSTLFEAMPKQVAGFKAYAKEAFDEKQLGFAVKMRSSDGGEATVYLYDAGLAQIGAGAVKSQFRQSAADMAKVNVMRGRVNSRDDRNFVPPGKPVFSLAKSSVSDADGATGIVDYIVAGQSGDCIVKLRLTTRKKLSAADKTLGALLNGLAAKLGA